MGIEVNVDCTCTECGGSLDDGDDVYCDSCQQELKDKIAELETQVEELEEQLEECKEGCSECNNRMDCVTSKDRKVGK